MLIWKGFSWVSLKRGGIENLGAVHCQKLGAVVSQLVHTPKEWVAPPPPPPPGCKGGRRALRTRHLSHTPGAHRVHQRHCVPGCCPRFWLCIVSIPESGGPDHITRADGDVGSPSRRRPTGVRGHNIVLGEFYLLYWWSSISCYKCSVFTNPQSPIR